MRTSFRNCIAAGWLLLPMMASHADDGKARYVAGTGRDTGDCLNKFRPCRTLSFAIAQAGKGDVINAAEGRYELDTTQQLTDLLTMQGRIAAGFDANTGFSDRTASDKTLLIGVPPDLRERFEQNGFTVITDTKGIFDSAATRTEINRKRALAATVVAAEKAHAAAPCVGSQSNGFACQSMSLLAHLPLTELRPSSQRGNDVWGYVDLNTGREYVFMGVQNGVSVVDITNPAAPEQVAIATGTSTTWRNIKVYQRYDDAARRWRAYAYVTADAVSDFSILLDLSSLPNSVESVSTTWDFRSAHTAYMVNTDYTYGLAEKGGTALLAVAGAGVNSGRHRLYSLAQPRSPQLLTASTGGYAHDLVSYSIVDARKSQCIDGAAAKCDVLVDFNENTVDVWDVTNTASATMLTSHAYTNTGFVHSGWWTEDGRYLLVHDELDEQNLGLNTTVRVFDMSNLRSPLLFGSWVGPTRAIDHNGYVRGNRYYFSNYSEGATVLDLTSPTTPQRIGYFDTYPSSSQTGFVGAWGIYPFFPSGTVAVSDINTGLYLLKDETLSSPNGSFAFASRSISGIEGQSVTLSITRTNGSAGAVSVDIDLLYGTADASDAILASTNVSWIDGDTQPKSVVLNLPADARSEGMEVLFARLKSPRGGATLVYPDSAAAYIAEPGATTRLRLLESPMSIDEDRAKAILTLTRGGSLAGAAQVSFRTVPNASYTGFTSQQGELTWTDGDASAKSVTIVVDPLRLTAGQSGALQVEFFGAANATLETANGTNAALLTADVTIVGAGQATAPVTPIGGGNSGGRRGGGGAMPLWWLGLLGMLCLSRAKSRAVRGNPAAR